MSNFRQNKAHQTVQAMGCADNPLVKGLSNGTKHRCECGAILNPFNDGVNHLIAKNYRKLQFDNQKQPNRWGWMGHNGDSLKSWQHPASVLRFFSSPFMAMRPLARALSAMAGVLGNSNVPAVHDGESTTATLSLGVVLKSQIRGGYHA